MKKVDYTTFNNPAAVEAQIDKRWWLLEAQELAQSVIKIVNYLAQNDGKRQTQYQINARLYGNYNLFGINGLTYSKIQSSQSTIKDRVTYNVVQSVIDTITAKIAKNKPKSAFLTSGGNWKLQRKAKKLEKFCDGIAYENKSHVMQVNAFRDAAIYGDGLIQVFAQHGRVKWDRVFPSELYVDFVDSYYGNPRQLYRVKSIDRQVLIEEFPDKKEEILRAPATRADDLTSIANISDQVTVAEAWHLPSGPKAKDGMHAIVVEDAVLFVEPWKKEHFGFAKLAWSRGLFGWWSQGIPEQIQSIQLEINKIAWVIQRSMHLAGTFKIWLKNGSKVVKEQLNNDIGAVINSDEPPQYLLPPIVAPEVYQRLQVLKQDAFEQVGVSMLSAAAKKPEGLDSGKALREYNDIESDRFMIIGQAYEDLRLQLDALSIEVAKEIAASEGGFDVKAPAKKFLETISWSEIDLEADEYLMKAYPVSSLPNEPAGRLQTVQEYVQAGFYSPRTAKRLLDMPDLEQVDDLQDSNENWVHKALENIIEDNDYTPPEPEMDLQLAKELVLEYIAQAYTSGLEEEKIASLRLFNSQIDALVQKPLPPPPPAAAGMPQGGQPQAVPQAPPISPMIPNASGAA